MKIRKIFAELVSSIKRQHPLELLNKLYTRYPNLKNILHNSGWLFFDKIFRMGMGMFLGVWIARYLGPDNYGKLNYVIAYTALIGSFTNLGLDGVAVRELIKEKLIKKKSFPPRFYCSSSPVCLPSVVQLF